MQYVCDLEKVWSLPVGFGQLRKNGKFCAIGLVMAGCIGEDQVPEVFQRDCPLGNALYDLKLDPDFGMKFDAEVVPFLEGESEDIKKAEQIREKYVRIILQKAMEEGLIVLEDSDLSIVRELQAKINNQKLTLCQ